jgi:hypothetical protein
VRNAKDCFPSRSPINGRPSVLQRVRIDEISGDGTRAPKTEKNSNKKGNPHSTEKGFLNLLFPVVPSINFSALKNLSFLDATRLD